MLSLLCRRSFIVMGESTTVSHAFTLLVYKCYMKACK